MGSEMYKPDQLPTLANAYDIAVIDCPPNQGEIQRAALMIADLAILPCGPSAPDVWAMADSIELIKRAKSLRSKLRTGVLITRKLSRTLVGQSARQMFSDNGYPLFQSELGWRVAYQEALAAGQGVTTYAPNTTAAKELLTLSDEVEQWMRIKKRRRRAA